MWTDKTDLRCRETPAARWTRSLAGRLTGPAFPPLPARLSPYLLAATLFVTASAAMGAGHAALLRDGLPWALVSVLVVAAAANFWGTRPALLVLALSVLYGAAVVSHMGPAPPPVGRALALRSLGLAACGAATIALTDRARRMQERAESRRAVVTALRSMILPDALTSVPGYDAAALCRPARADEEVGGDFYDLFPLGDGRYGLLLGDVQGKGKEAASSTALLRYAARALTSAGSGPALVLSHLAALLDAQEPEFGTASLFLGILDVASGRLRYASAGHEPPLLRHAGGEEEALRATGPVLGAGPGVAYAEDAVVLWPGDALLLLTDGVTEARNVRGDFLESAGVRCLLRAALSVPAAWAAVAAMEAALVEYTAGGPRDDVALLLLRRAVRG